MPEEPRRRPRRAIRLSETDRRRLAAGEITDPTQALHAPEVPPPGGAESPEGEQTPAAGSSPGKAPPRRTRPSAEDERILREVPPHFGSL